MEIIEVPGLRWREALDTFSAAHDGWLVSLDVLDAELGAQPLAVELPLLGLTVETNAPQTTITITVGLSASAAITHVIASPARIWIERAHDGAESALQVESEGGQKTILRFRMTPIRVATEGPSRPVPSQKR